MPQPEGAQIDFGYSTILTNIGVNYLPKLDQFVGRKLFPTVPTATPTGLYNIWNRGDFLRRNGKKIANYEAVPLGGFSGAQGTFNVTNWGVGTPYTARDLANARRGGTTDQAYKNAKTRWVTTQAVLEMEFRVRDLIQTTANWSTTIAGVTSGPNATQFVQWDQAAATPVDDVLGWKRKMRQLTGFVPNTMVIPERIMLALKKNAQLISRVTPMFYSGTAPVAVTEEQIKALFGIPNILTPLAMYNSAAEGQADVLVDIWTDTIMWMGYVTDSPSTEEPTAAYNFAWTGDTTTGLPAGMGTGEGPQNFGAVMNEEGLFVRNYPDIPRGAMVIEGMIWSSPVVVGAALGMTWTATIV